MIRLFDKNTTDYTGNGICVLRPSVCTVSESAGGSYELYMEHPMDKEGRYRLLEEDRQIMAPVPQTHIPEINMPGTTVYRTTAAADLYSKLPVYKRRNKEESDKIVDLSQHQANNSWSSSKGYNEGSYVVYLSTHTIYRARKFNKGVTPGTDSSIWQYICKTLNPGQTTPGEYIPGTVAETLPTNTVVYKLADYDATYIQVRTLVGGVGYVKRELVQDEETPHAGEVFPEQNFNEQVFRIYNIESEDDTHTYKVYARHISYDFRGNCLYDCQMTKADPMTAIATLEGALMIPDNRIIATDIADGEVTADWSFKNPINAILDPDTGLASILGARVIRNNRNIFLLSEQGKMVNPVTISYGVNMKGVSWSRNNENIYTRIIPRCSDGNSGYLYIDSVFVDSPHINDYPFIRILPLDCPFSVGEEYELPTGEKATRTEESCRAEMLEEAQKKFSQEKIDTVDITLRVDFVLMGDTEEYRQYRGLQFINTYDVVTVNTGISDIQEDAIVWEYEYDSILKRFNSITLRTIKSYKQRIAGYQVQNQSITYSKLSPELANRIRTGDDSGSTSSGSGGYDPQGGVVEFTTPNTATEDGIVTKGQGNANKVWATDENGNPAWRNESGYTLPAASDSELGGVMTGFTAYGKNYPVALDSGNRAYVYVPWEAGSYTLPLADNGVRGGIQIGFTAYGKNYPVALDGEKAYVYVPWTDESGNNRVLRSGDTMTGDLTLYAASGNSPSLIFQRGDDVGSLTDWKIFVQSGWLKFYKRDNTTSGEWVEVSQISDSGIFSGSIDWTHINNKPTVFYTLPLAASGTRGGVQIGYSQSGKNYPVQLSDEKMYVNVPWTDESGNNRVLRAGDTMTGNLYVNRPDTNDATVNVKNSYGAMVALMAGQSGKTGVYSYGYYNGSTFVSDTKYMVERLTDGKIHLAGEADSVPWSGTNYPGMSSLINGMDVGSSPSEINDYLISQYAGGGTTYTTYYRRKVSDVVNGTVVKYALGTNATHGGAYLRKDGTWQVPPGTYSLPLAGNGTRGGVQVGYTQSGKNYPVQLSGEKAYVYVPWTDESGNNRVLRSGDTMTGDLTLYAASGNSPSLIFQRGDDVGSLTDWKIFVQSGWLKFYKRDNTTSGSWAEVAHITDYGLYTGNAATATNADQVDSYHAEDLLTEVDSFKRRLQVRTGSGSLVNNTDTYIAFSSPFTTYCAAVVPVSTSGFNAPNALSIVSNNKNGVTLKQNNTLGVSMNVIVVAFGY